ncbi:HipA domain-containing protein [Niabella aquatica]
MTKRGNLRREKSLFKSGKILRPQSIPTLKESDYIVQDIPLDGDAPKQFIRAYFFERDGTVRKANPKTWSAYIAKTAEKYYPHESIYEYLINRIGQTLGLEMNEIKLVWVNKQVRFLSKFFLKDGEELIHGAEICGEHLGDKDLANEIANDRKSSRELFTFEFIKESIRNVFPKTFDNLLVGLVKMIIFDAIVGNNDRHFYNWGVIRTQIKSQKLPTFAPLYDSARGLFWNCTEAQVNGHLEHYSKNGKKVVNYIEKAYPRISIADNIQANHFELIEYLIRLNTDYISLIDEFSSTENEIKVLKMIKQEFSLILTIKRVELISLILKTRFEKIRRLTNVTQDQKLVQ